MHLSKIWLAPDRLDNAWEWHRALWTLFPGIRRQPGESAPFLYRMEKMSLVQGAEVMVQSSLSPAKKSSRARLLASRDIDPRPRKGQKLAFRLTANVTKAIRDKDQPERKIRVPLIKEWQQIDWLKRKLDGSADHFSTLHIQPHRPTYFRKGNRNRPGKIVTVSFEGILEVEDPEALVDQIAKGIGPAKAFGCGLMLLRRI